MDIRAIEDAIEELEMDETTVENVQKLSSLYICRSFMKNSNLTASSSFNSDVNEVLPAYSRYCFAKKSYQIGNGSEESVYESLTLLCEEIRDLYASLYSSSSSRKERKIIRSYAESTNSVCQNK